MASKTIEYLNPPQVIRTFHLEGSQERRASNWITAWDFAESLDAGIIGIPLTKGTFLPTGADTTPNGIRKALVYCTTYNPDLGVDIQSLKVRHVGDVRLHGTDLVENHRRIEAALGEVFEQTGDSVNIILGGDGSITAPAVKAMVKASNQSFGIIQFDSRVDTRDAAEGGYSDLTSARAILEADIGVSGRNMVQLGIHGFLSGMEEQRWAEDKGVTVITAREVSKLGIEAAVERALGIASDGTDGIYVSLDGTVLEITSSGSALASAPGGLSLKEMQEALFLIGQNAKVNALDLVGIDTFNDIKDVVARASAGMILTFLAGLKLRG